MRAKTPNEQIFCKDWSIVASYMGNISVHNHIQEFFAILLHSSDLFFPIFDLYTIVYIKTILTCWIPNGFDLYLSLTMGGCDFVVYNNIIQCKNYEDILLNSTMKG